MVSAPALLRAEQTAKGSSIILMLPSNCSLICLSFYYSHLGWVRSEFDVSYVTLAKVYFIYEGYSNFVNWDFTLEMFCLYIRVRVNSHTTDKDSLKLINKFKYQFCNHSFLLGFPLRRECNSIFKDTYNRHSPDSAIKNWCNDANVVRKKNENESTIHVVWTSSAISPALYPKLVKRI